MCADPSRVIGPPAVQCRRAPTAAAGRNAARRPVRRRVCVVRALSRVRARERAKHVYNIIMWGVCVCVCVCVCCVHTYRAHRFTPFTLDGCGGGGYYARRRCCLLHFRFALSRTLVVMIRARVLFLVPDTAALRL
ncbi:unnamed protein product [Aphis gossypii]|uniref:Uncharacterized protein n=1 Tax=Aphis gossypii TaxID=80765 RepID=A0A9P0N7W9_APHGO|nr:unnamed protein product [Aphis gossypii]